MAQRNNPARAQPKKDEELQKELQKRLAERADKSAFSPKPKSDKSEKEKVKTETEKAVTDIKRGAEVARQIDRIAPPSSVPKTALPTTVPVVANAQVQAPVRPVQPVPQQTRQDSPSFKPAVPSDVHPVNQVPQPQEVAISEHRVKSAIKITEPSVKTSDVKKDAAPPIPPRPKLQPKKQGSAPKSAQKGAPGPAQLTKPDFVNVPPPDSVPPGPPDNPSGRPSGNPPPVPDRKGVYVSIMKEAKTLPFDADPADQPAAAAAAEFDKKMRSFMAGNSDVFTPASVIRINDGQLAYFGKPMKLGDGISSRIDYAIPVYIHSSPPGETRLVIAYLSQSQGVWRRFAGCDQPNGHYCKGASHQASDEHLQDFDWRIQQSLDRIFLETPPKAMPGAKLGDLGLFARSVSPRSGELRLILSAEKRLQDGMSSQAAGFDISDEGNRPSRLVGYWLGGKEDGVYGRHLNIVVRSENGKFDYGIAVTEDGIFVKFIQDARSGSVTVSGSPSIAPRLKEEDDWLMTPIIEYDIQTKDIRDMTAPSYGRRLSKPRFRKTFVAEGGRERIRGMHSSSQSPLFRLSNGLDRYCDLMRLGKYDEAKAALSKVAAGADLTSGKEPAAVPESGISALVAGKAKLLEDAFAMYVKSPDKADIDKDLLAMGLSPRELFLVKRYLSAPADDVAGMYADYMAAREKPDDPSSVFDEKYRLLVKAYYLVSSDPGAPGLDSGLTKLGVPADLVADFKNLHRLYQGERSERFREEAVEWAKAKYRAESVS